MLLGFAPRHLKRPYEIGLGGSTEFPVEERDGSGEPRWSAYGACLVRTPASVYDGHRSHLLLLLLAYLHEREHDPRVVVDHHPDRWRDDSGAPMRVAPPLDGVWFRTPEMYAFYLGDDPDAPGGRRYFADDEVPRTPVFGGMGVVVTGAHCQLCVDLRRNYPLGTASQPPVNPAMVRVPAWRIASEQLPVPGASAHGMPMDIDI